ncbi:MAG: hypothetical protein CENE_02833 [Candidatus Celerinatantimonas neptuna]|nr:MAG: hypothetical protein CENE_02833 [Candidatus Celerinatantimonas neptuna]
MESINLIGFFPGIGSRTDYKNIFYNQCLDIRGYLPLYLESIRKILGHNNSIYKAIVSGNIAYLSKLEKESYISILILVNNLVSLH